MKQLLNGVAIAAVFALAPAAFAQNAPMTPSTPPPATPPASAATAPMKPMHHTMTHHMVMKHHYSHHMASSGDQMTEQLNAQELARITGGAPAPAPSGPPPSNYQTPGKSDIAPAPPPPASK